MTKVEEIARMCHQTNKAWCEANGQTDQVDWEVAPKWQRDSAIAGVQFKLDNPEAGDDAQHNAWMKDKLEAGWVYGPVKDADKKEHHCLVSFDELPDFERKKDKLFGAIVGALK